MDRTHFLRFSNAFPEALILLSGSGEVLAANASAARQLGIPRCPPDGTRLEQFVDNTAEELGGLLKTWRRSRNAIPAALKWASATLGEANWRCEGFLSQVASRDAPARVIVRCTAGKAHASQFIALNRELDRQRITLRTLQESRDALEKEHEKAIVTLSSIGDAVITTDCNGMVEYLNPVAERLTGWSNDEAGGEPLTRVFNIVNELTRKPAVNPVERCLQQQAIIALTNHTALIAKDGTEYVIEDSAAPIDRIEKPLFLRAGTEAGIAGGGTRTGAARTAVYRHGQVQGGQRFGRTQCRGRAPGGAGAHLIRAAEAGRYPGAPGRGRVRNTARRCQRRSAALGQGN